MENPIDETVEIVKKEADELMMNKIIKYEKEIIKLKKEICELRQDNRKLAHEVEDRVNKCKRQECNER